LSRDPFLHRQELPPFATGVVRYADSSGAQTLRESRIVIPVVPRLIENPVMAVVDTAAPWCIFKPMIGDLIRAHLSPVDQNVELSTRLGVIPGDLYRLPITLPAEEGENLEVEATIFLSPEWRGENFVGYLGLLQRICFAVDPQSNLFYFGDLG